MMDGTGQMGPGKPNYAGDVRDVAKALADGRTAYVKLADKGTQLHLLLVRKADLCAPGGTPAGLDEHMRVPGHLMDPAGWLHVSVNEHGAYWFDLRGYTAAGYAADKLDVQHADGDTIAEFLTRLGHELGKMFEAAA